MDSVKFVSLLFLIPWASSKCSWKINEIGTSLMATSFRSPQQSHFVELYGDGCKNNDKATITNMFILVILGRGPHGANPLVTAVIDLQKQSLLPAGVRERWCSSGNYENIDCEGLISRNGWTEKDNIALAQKKHVNVMQNADKFFVMGIEDDWDTKRCYDMYPSRQQSSQFSFLSWDDLTYENVFARGQLKTKDLEVDNTEIEKRKKTFAMMNMVYSAAVERSILLIRKLSVTDPHDKIVLGIKDDSSKFWSYILTVLPRSDHVDLLSLVEKLLTIAPSTASVERSFSITSWMLGPKRERTSAETIDHYTRILFNGPPANIYDPTRDSVTWIKNGGYTTEGRPKSTSSEAAKEDLSGRHSFFTLTETIQDIVKIPELSDAEAESSDEDDYDDDANDDANDDRIQSSSSSTVHVEDLLMK